MTTAESIDVLTIGHSSHSWEHFVALLRGANVTAVADVCTAPLFRRHPQFNRDTPRDALRRGGISYVFLGQELGGRPAERRFYCDGVADYEGMARETEFHKGLDRVVDGARKYRITLMCSERDPLDCHRCLLVRRALTERGVRVSHILGDRKIVGHTAIEDRLLELAGRNTDDLFAPRAERLTTAYRERARKVAFAAPRPDGPTAAR